MTDEMRVQSWRQLKILYHRVFVTIEQMEQDAKNGRYRDIIPLCADLERSCITIQRHENTMTATMMSQDIG